MKNYYQANCEYKLEHSIYRKIVNQVKCYKFYKSELKRIEESSQITEEDISNKVVAEYYIELINKALISWVSDEFREMVYKHMIEGVQYKELKKQYYYSESTMKRWTQIFIYGVAKELGEDFTSSESLKILK